MPSEVVKPISQSQCKVYDQSIKAIMENVESNKNDSRNMTSGVVSPPLTKSSASPPRSPDLHLSYNQINCLENVHRLLKSQSSTNPSSQNTATSANSSSGKSVPLTRELLTQHDRRWEAVYKGNWHRRLQLKRSLSSNGTPDAAPAKLSRTEPTNSSASTPFNPNSCQSTLSNQLLQYLSAILAQSQRQTPQVMFTQPMNWLNPSPQTSSTNF